MANRRRLLTTVSLAILGAGCLVATVAFRRHLPAHRLGLPRIAPAESREFAQDNRRGPVGAASGTSPIQLRDVTHETGITFQHTDGSSGQYYIAETVSSGLALFDYDHDGLVDIYFPNGAPLAAAGSEGSPEATSPRPRHALYKNLGQWRFVDVTEKAGIVGTSFGLGATAADYDNDGFLDLYVSNFGAKMLYHNNGDGTFTDVSAHARVTDGHKLGAGVCFLDIEADGDLDLFVANYVRFSLPTNIREFHEGFPEYASPKRYPPEAQTLFRNNGDGTFADISESSGIARHLGKGMGMVCADFDRDGDTDIFLLNDVFENFCFSNNGSGKFEEIALVNGLKFNGEGVPLGSMGAECGDYDNDGWLDFYQTSYQGELPVLFRNLGNGNFADVTRSTGAGQGTVNNVKWGCGLVDFDNDGYRDIFVAMGHLQDRIDEYDRSTSFRAPNVLLRNDGRGRFDDVSQLAGDGLLPRCSSRGAAFDDLDNDGDIDVVVLNARDRPTLLRNMQIESRADQHWLQVQLRGVKANRDGVGAQVVVTSGDLTLTDEVHSGRSYQSHYGSRLHFGLGRRNRVDRIAIRWIGGGMDLWENVPADQWVTIIEGEGSKGPKGPM